MLLGLMIVRLKATYVNHNRHSLVFHVEHWKQSTDDRILNEHVTP